MSSMYIYGDRRDYGKIDVFINGKYRCTTPWASTLREAKEKYLEANPEVVPEVVEVRYADTETSKHDVRRRVNMWI